MSALTSSGRRLTGRKWVAVVIAAAAIAGAFLVGGLVGGLTTGALVAATLRAATPLVLASLGGLFSERSGIVNIGLEGMMLMGAFVGFVVAAESGSWVLAVLAAVVAAAALAALHGVASIYFGADQIISGTAINLLGLSVTAYVFRALYGLSGGPINVPRVPEVTVPLLGEGGPLRPVLGGVNLLTLLMLLLVPTAWWVLFRTRIGTWIRAAGEMPLAAQTVGINVRRLRLGAVTVSGALAGLGGVYLSVGLLGSFAEGMTAGRGFIALAGLIVGRWHPFGLFGAAILFASVSSVGFGLQGGSGINPDLISILPYLLTLATFVAFRRAAVAPAALGRPLENP